MDEHSGDRVAWPRSTIWLFILLFISVLILCAGLRISQTVLPSTDKALTMQHIGGISALIAGAIWCLAGYLFTHWQRRFLATTIIITGFGATLVVTGLLAVLPILLGAELVLVFMIGCLLMLIVGGIALVRWWPLKK